MHVVHVQCIDKTLQCTLAFHRVINQLLVKPDCSQSLTDFVLHFLNKKKINKWLAILNYSFISTKT